jgi:hypothetical protein
MDRLLGTRSVLYFEKPCWRISQSGEASSFTSAAASPSGVANLCLSVQQSWQFSLQQLGPSRRPAWTWPELLD